MFPILFIIFFIALFVIMCISIFGIIYRKNQLRRYTQIQIGMTADEMLSVMGSGYNVSQLKGNRQKYEWRIAASSTGSKGFRTYSGVHKVDIYVKNGYVEEIRPYNVQ